MAELQLCLSTRRVTSVDKLSVLIRFGSMLNLAVTLKLPVI
jgi:hypothetical protein